MRANSPEICANCLKICTNFPKSIFKQYCYEIFFEPIFGFTAYPPHRGVHNDTSHFSVTFNFFRGLGVSRGFPKSQHFGATAVSRAAPELFHPQCSWYLSSPVRDTPPYRVQHPFETVSHEYLSSPVRDTPPYRLQHPFEIVSSIAEGGIARVCLVFIGYRASIAEISLLRGGYRTSTPHALQEGNAQKRGRGYRTQLPMLRHQKPHSAQ